MAEPTRNEVTINYMITISCQQKLLYVSKEAIEDVILWLKMNIPSIHIYHCAYERTGKYNQLHFHGVVSVRRGLRYKPFTQFGDREWMNRTFRVQWELITNMGGAIDYVYKDTQNSAALQDQIFDCNFYKYHFFDIDQQKAVRLAQ